MGDGLCADEPERRDVHYGGVHGEVHGQAVGQVRRAVDRLHGEEHPDDWLIAVTSTHGPTDSSKLKPKSQTTQLKWRIGDFNLTAG